MGISFDSMLTNSRGVNKIILFKGLEQTAILTPSLLGEPIFTAQPFYFLDEMECVIRIRFEDMDNSLTELSQMDFEGYIEDIIDNYLFEYLRRYPDSKVTSKITHHSFWENNASDAYFRSDNMNIEYLALDVLNDDSIQECYDQESGLTYNDWCLLKNYPEWSFEEYVDNLKKLLNKQVVVKVQDNDVLGTGTVLLPLVKPNPTILNYFQAEMFDVVSTQGFREDQSYYHISRGMESSYNFRIAQEVIETSKTHNKELLAYLFSAIRDHSPLTQFRNLYNVIEYFFEEATQRTGASARTERDMILEVFNWAIPQEELFVFLSGLSLEQKKALTDDQVTSSSVPIQGFDISDANLLRRISSRIYDIRNACMHSKKTRRGVNTARFVPTTSEENILRNEYPLMLWLAIKIIEKDTDEQS